MLSRLAPGTTVAGFVVHRLLHTGGNGYVYEVSPPPSDAPPFPLVMKVPGIGPGEPALGPGTFDAEQMIHATLGGPHVPRFVAAGLVDALPYLVMERVEGTGLQQLVERAPLTAEEVARIGASIADALHDLHRQHVVHCDLRPENVMLSANGDAVLLDFGFSHHARLPDLLAEEKHFAAGSAAYVSPEQLRGRRSDPRSDLFALGVMLYELATGAKPFGEPVTQRGTEDRLWRVPAPPRALKSDVPPWLQEIVLHALEVDAERRYASAALLAFDLRHPDQVAVGPRGERTLAEGFASQARRWWKAKRPQLLPGTHEQRTAPVVLVAIDTEHPDDDRHPALLAATRKVIADNADYRLMLVSVIGAAPLGEGVDAMDTASGRQIEHRHRLRHWAEPMRLPPSRQSLHVVEGSNPARMLLDLAEANNVDLIVLGAPPPLQHGLAWWRSAASSVTAGARCSVLVVRAANGGGAATTVPAAS